MYARDPVIPENLRVQKNNFSRVFSKKSNISVVSEEKLAGTAGVVPLSANDMPKSDIIGLLCKLQF